MPDVWQSEKKENSGGYKVYFPTANGTIFVLNKDNGRIISKFDANDGGCIFRSRLDTHFGRNCYTVI